MNFPKRTRYNKIMRAMQDFFINESYLSGFPIDPFKVIENNQWGLITYTELMQKHNCTLEDVIASFGSKDGFTIFDGEGYTISYNDTIRTPGRIRFTLLHEIGHIYLNHLLDFEKTMLTRNGLNKRQYEVLEREANAFARNVLAPAAIVKYLKLRTVDELISHFHLSYTAARARLDSLKWDSAQSRKYALTLLELFKDYLRRVQHTKFCLRCSHQFINETAKHCPICSHTVFSKGGIPVIYDGFDLDHTGYPAKCPRCENKKIGGNYCKICGQYLINECTNYHINYGGNRLGCGNPAEGDARFCMDCGHPTTYFRDGLLKPWNEVKAALEAKKKINEIYEDFGDELFEEVATTKNHS